MEKSNTVVMGITVDEKQGGNKIIDEITGDVSSFKCWLNFGVT